MYHSDATVKSTYMCKIRIKQFIDKPALSEARNTSPQKERGDYHYMLFMYGNWIYDKLTLPACANWFVTQN